MADDHPEREVFRAHLEMLGVVQVRSLLLTAGFSPVDAGLAHTWLNEKESESTATSAGRTRWEYKFLRCESLFVAEAELTALGDDGWELSVVTSSPLVLVLKRPK